MFMVNTPDPDQVREYCVKTLGLPEFQADEAIQDAKETLTRTAEVHRDKELALSITALRDLYSSAREAGELKLALDVRKELNRLLGLYMKEHGEVEFEDMESIELEDAREHLEPLELAPAGTPVSELARLAALKLTDK